MHPDLGAAASAAHLQRIAHLAQDRQAPTALGTNAGWPPRALVSDGEDDLVAPDLGDDVHRLPQVGPRVLDGVGGRLAHREDEIVDVGGGHALRAEPVAEGVPEVRDGSGCRRERPLEPSEVRGQADHQDGHVVNPLALTHEFVDDGRDERDESVGGGSVGHVHGDDHHEHPRQRHAGRHRRLRRHHQLGESVHGGRAGGRIGLRQIDNWPVNYEIDRTYCWIY